MMWIIFVLIVLALYYLFKNGRRNSDPLNRKCAAEICTLLIEKEDVQIEDVVEVFQENARYRTNAIHICSMVPPLLIKAGFPRQQAMACYGSLKVAASALPK